MTPLRQRFTEDLQRRNYAPKTVSCYVAHVARFAAHFGRSPDRLDAEHVRLYQLHLLAHKASWSRFNQAVCALRFFYGTTLQRPDVVVLVPYGKKPKSLPAVLSTAEVARLFAAVTDPRDLLILQTAYAAGLRVSEVIRLQLGDIDAARMVLHVRCAKGRKDRLVPLSAVLLQRLRDYWRRYRPAPWLFPGQTPGSPVSVGQVQRLCQRAVRAAGITKKASMHTLRNVSAHCSITIPGAHLLPSSSPIQPGGLPRAPLPATRRRPLPRPAWRRPTVRHPCLDARSGRLQRPVRRTPAPHRPLRPLSTPPNP
jgi:integrase/recombinase XerD